MCGSSKRHRGFMGHVRWVQLPYPLLRSRHPTRAYTQNPNGSNPLLLTSDQGHRTLMVLMGSLLLVSARFYQSG